MKKNIPGFMYPYRPPVESPSAWNHTDEDKSGHEEGKRTHDKRQPLWDFIGADHDNIMDSIGVSGVETMCEVAQSTKTEQGQAEDEALLQPTTAAHAKLQALFSSSPSSCNSPYKLRVKRMTERNVSFTFAQVNMGCYPEDKDLPPLAKTEIPARCLS